METQTFECPCCHLQFHTNEFDGGTCKSCAELNYWIDPSHPDIVHHTECNDVQDEDPDYFGIL